MDCNSRGRSLINIIYPSPCTAAEVDEIASLGVVAVPAHCTSEVTAHWGPVFGWFQAGFHGADVQVILEALGKR